MIIPNRDLMPLIGTLLQKKHKVRLRVTGSSMEPFIREGDQVELEKSQSLSFGEVALASLPRDRYVLHRIVRIKKDRIWLRGDAQRNSDGPIAFDRVLARVSAVYRKNTFRRVPRLCWMGLARLWLALHPMGLIALDMLYGLKKLAQKMILCLQSFRIVRFVLGKKRLNYRIVRETYQDSKLNAEVTCFKLMQRGKKLGQTYLVRFSPGAVLYRGYWLVSLEVALRYRGRSLGQALTEQVIELAKAESAPYVSLLVSKQNLPAQKLYQKLGFMRVKGVEEQILTREDQKRLGHQRVLLRKILK